jgi:hypothetical protein
MNGYYYFRASCPPRREHPKTQYMGVYLSTEDKIVCFEADCKRISWGYSVDNSRLRLNAPYGVKKLFKFGHLLFANSLI